MGVALVGYVYLLAKKYRAHFPALDAGYMYLPRVAIGSLCFSQSNYFGLGNVQLKTRFKNRSCVRY